MNANNLVNQGIDQFNGWQRAALETLNQAIEADPELGLAYAAKGLAIAGGRDDRFQPMLEECSAAVQRFAKTPREQVLSKALHALASGRFDIAIVTLEAWLVANPTDLLAHRILQQELFWTGEAVWMRDVAARARPAWSDELPDFGGFLSVFAFSHEEAGDRDVAERAGREAIERNPADAWGAHAVAHVLEMQGRHAEGIAWLESLSGNWGSVNQIAHHLWWHLCLYYLETNEYERILTLLTEQVRNVESPLVQAVPDAYIDIQNVASLLMRLELRGVADLSDHWAVIAEPALSRIDNHPNPFTSAHAALALASAGRFDEAQQVVTTLASAADRPGPLGPRIHAAALPAARAAVAHRRHDFDAVVEILFPARRALWQMGGSHAQRDLFGQILADACRKTGRQEHLAILHDDLQSCGFVGVAERSFYSACLAA